LSNLAKKHLILSWKQPSTHFGFDDEYYTLEGLVGSNVVLPIYNVVFLYSLSYNFC